jgi:hypothetical protein
MLHTVTRIRGAIVRALDGDVGVVEEVVFDDVTWTVRYLMVKTGPWLMNRPVLISPMVIDSPWSAGVLPTKLTREQLRTSPIVESHKEVSREHEARLLAHYGLPFYWENLPSGPSAPDRPPVKPGDERLCAVREVTGFHIQTSDCEIGHVDDVLIDDNNWRIEYLLVDTSHWIDTKSVLISPSALRGIDWSQSRMRVALTPDLPQRNSPAPAVPGAGESSPVVRLTP